MPKPKTRDYYLAQPCFMHALEKAFGPTYAYSPDDLEEYYQLWEDGYRMGRYCEATKDAEGS